MKKILLIPLSIFLIFVFVLVVGSTNEWFGLFHKNTNGNTIDYSFIGTWNVNHSYYENGTKIDEWKYTMTLYLNGTSKFESENHSQITWVPYIFKKNQICYDDGKNEICYTIEYQDSGNRMILTGIITTQYGEVTVVRDCKRK